MNTEAWLSDLEQESNSLKQAFARAAYSIPVFTRSISHSTSSNAITMAYTGGGSFTSFDRERMIVTYTTVSGANTVAKLEMTFDSENPSAIVRRVPYSGGARWEVSVLSKNLNVGSWETTNCVFVTQSLVDGVITITEAAS